MTPGTCAACGGAAERGPSGAWWHLSESCWARNPVIAHPGNYVRAVFVPLTGGSDPGTIKAADGNDPSTWPECTCVLDSDGHPLGFTDCHRHGCVLCSEDGRTPADHNLGDS